jgi:hypothetical protein
MPERLAPPGAGLPRAELAWVRPMFWLARHWLSDARASARFRGEAEWMMRQVDALPSAIAAQPVLIERVVGIEDSSRGWSACMVLEHLRIVDRTIIEIIETLSRGDSFGQEIRTADVKPRRGIGRNVLGEFGAVLVDYATRVEPALARRTRAKHAHPWFGPLDAHGWHCLAAIHHTLHRRQLAAILRELGRSG